MKLHASKRQRRKEIKKDIPKDANTYPCLLRSLDKVKILLTALWYDFLPPTWYTANMYPLFRSYCPKKKK